MEFRRGLFRLFFSILTSLLLAMLVPVILAGALLPPEWRWCRLLGLAPLRFIGRISYSLYLWQELFLVPGWMRNPVAAQHWSAAQHWGSPQHWPLNLVATFGAAAASYYLIEAPCIRFGRLAADRAWRNLKPRMA